MSRREDCLVSPARKHVVFTSWFHSVIHFDIWSCRNVYILLLVSWVFIYKSGRCYFCEELIVFLKLESSMHNRECSALANLARIEYGESSLGSRFSIFASIECQLTFKWYSNLETDISSEIFFWNTTDSCHFWTFVTLIKLLITCDPCATLMLFLTRTRKALLELDPAVVLPPHRVQNISQLLKIRAQLL